MFHEAFTIFGVQQKRLVLYAPQLHTMTAGNEDLATLSSHQTGIHHAGIHQTGIHQAGIHQTGIQHQVLCSH